MPLPCLARRNRSATESVREGKQSYLSRDQSRCIDALACQAVSGGFAIGSSLLLYPPCRRCSLQVHKIQLAGIFHSRYALYEEPNGGVPNILVDVSGAPLPGILLCRAHLFGAYADAGTRWCHRLVSFMLFQVARSSLNLPQ